MESEPESRRAGSAQCGTGPAFGRERACDGRTCSWPVEIVHQGPPRPRADASERRQAALPGCSAAAPARNSQLINASATTAPTNSAAMKPGRSTGRMPEKVLLSERAMATAGLAKDVEAVNQ